MDEATAGAFAMLTTGIYVLTVADGTLHHGMSSSWVTQVSGEPPRFSAAIDRAHFSNAIVQRTGRFGLNVVGHRGKALEDYFFSAAAKRADNLADFEYELSPRLQVPWLALACAALEARVSDAIDIGDHTIFIGDPVGVRLNRAQRPLTSLELDYVYVGGKSVLKRDRLGWES